MRSIELGPPGIVVIAQIKDISSAGLDRHRLRSGDVVDPGWSDRRIDRPVGVGVVDHVQLGAAYALGKAGPAEAAGVEPEPGCIDQIGGLGQGAAQTAMRAGNHQREQLAEYRARPQRVGIGQRRTPRQPGPDVVEPHRMALQTGDDIAQARCPRQLTVEQRHELAFRGQLANPRIGSVRCYQPVKFIPRQML